MSRLRYLFQIYTMVLTGVVFAVAVFTTVVNPIERVESALLWQMSLVSGMCTLMSLVVYPWRREMGKVEAIVRTIVHYALINAVVLGSGVLFDWYNPSEFSSVAAMMLSIAIIFGVITAISWRKGIKEADKMNKRLEEYQKEKSRERDHAGSQL
ncbi:MAG: DUF3021 domain-containing protein [Eubacterium sp.]|nr:DUF3021 domain-containing protein [Eubacterium sp.]MCM1216748.1 DUF3021 domain-containing protein [Lachnospiraceae bacterium]MCM1238796.1 DUF3021 domain-containing protein [Lachnospiraceae bacterium]